VSSEAQGIGFAVPINVAREVLGQLRDRGHVQRGYLGIQLNELDPDLARMIGLREARGALVLDVVEDEPAAKAGLRRWDVITTVSGEAIADGDALVRMISGLRPGTEVELGVVRDGRPVTIAARLEERDSADEPSAGGTRPAASPARKGDALGLSVATLLNAARLELRVPRDHVGVVIQEVLGSDPGADALEEGDLVVEVNRQATPDAASYRSVVGALAPGEPAWLYVFRPGQRQSFLTRVEVEKRP
jgi:serine protease Do